MNKNTLITSVILITATIATVLILVLPNSNTAPPERFYFGFDSRLGQKEDELLYRPLMKYLSDETGYDFRIRFTSGYETTQENLGKGYTHFAALGAVSYIKAREQYGVNILVRGLNKANKAEYQSLIFTYPDNEIETLEDIKGKSFAFGSEDSTQGHLIPRKMLEDENITLDDLSSFEYTGSHTNAVEAVIDGRFDVGGGQDTLVREMVDQGKVKIIAESKFYPSSGIVANKNIDPKVVKAVKEALLALDPTGEHKDILPHWDQTEMPNGFVNARDTDYWELEEMMEAYGF